MKLYKIFAISLAALAFTACSDDDDKNTAAAVVQMGEPQMEVSEDYVADHYCYVPITVEGTTNGPVTVTVDVSGSSDNPAVENEQYVITSKTITIPAGENTGYIEFHTAGDDVVNEDNWEFVMTIVKAEGATIGNNKSTLIRIIDNEGLFIPIYEGLQGEWNVSAPDTNPYAVTITTYPSDDEKYMKKVLVSGWGGASFMECEMDCVYDPTTDEVTLSVPVGTYLGTANFGAPIGVANVFITGVLDTGGLTLGGITSCVSNTEHTQFTFNNALCGGIFNSDFSGASFAGYVFFLYDTCTWTKAVY